MMRHTNRIDQYSVLVLLHLIETRREGFGTKLSPIIFLVSYSIKFHDPIFSTVWLPNMNVFFVAI